MKVSEVYTEAELASDLEALADIPTGHLESRRSASARDGRALAMAHALDRDAETGAALMVERQRWARFNAELKRRDG